MKVNITNLISFLQSGQALFFSDLESFIMKVESNLYVIKHSFYSSNEGEELHYTDLQEVRWFIRTNKELFTDLSANSSRTEKKQDELSFNEYYEAKFDTTQDIKSDMTLDIMKALYAAYMVVVNWNSKLINFIMIDVRLTPGFISDVTLLDPGVVPGDNIPGLTPGYLVIINSS